jgi:hypothetical protein
MLAKYSKAPLLLLQEKEKEDEVKKALGTHLTAQGLTKKHVQKQSTYCLQKHSKEAAFCSD